jgi:hypothetical protein
MLSEIRSHSFLWPAEIFGLLDDVFDPLGDDFGFVGYLEFEAFCSTVN